MTAQQTRRALATLLLLLGAALVVARPTYAADNKWYRVEVIIFTQSDAYMSEGPPRVGALSYPQKLIRLDRNDYGYRALQGRDELRLSAEAYTLNRTGVYRVLYHRTWAQPGLSRKRAPWIHLNAQRGDRQLAGSLRVYLEDYLHLEADAWLAGPIGTTQSAAPTGLLTLPPAPFASVPNTAGPLALNEMGSPVDTGPVVHEVLRQAQRLKLDKLQYFDHPRMGILARVSRLKPGGQPAAGN